MACVCAFAESVSRGDRFLETSLSSDRCCFRHDKRFEVIVPVLMSQANVQCSEYPYAPCANTHRPTSTQYRGGSQIRHPSGGRFQLRWTKLIKVYFAWGLLSCLLLTRQGEKAVGQDDGQRVEGGGQGIVHRPSLRSRRQHRARHKPQAVDRGAEESPRLTAEGEFYNLQSARPTPQPRGSKPNSSGLLLKRETDGGAYNVFIC